MDGSPDLMIAGSVAFNAVLRWRIDADNVVLKMRGLQSRPISIAVHYSERPLRASGGLARSAAAQQYRSVQSNHAAGRQGLNLGLAVTDL